MVRKNLLGNQVTRKERRGERGRERERERDRERERETEGSLKLYGKNLDPQSQEI